MQTKIKFWQLLIWYEIYGDFIFKDKAMTVYTGTHISLDYKTLKYLGIPAKI